MPNLGVLSNAAASEATKTLGRGGAPPVLADLPGLIEGACAGSGGAGGGGEWGSVKQSGAGQKRGR